MNYTTEKRVCAGGFVQYREVAVDGSGPLGEWQFAVLTFDATCSGQSGFCNVARADGTSARVAIDAQDRLSINGRKYGRRNWNH